MTTDTDVAAFKQESGSGGSDAEVKDFAARTLPTLEEHLKEAQSIAPKVLQSDRASMESTNPSH